MINSRPKGAPYLLKSRGIVVAIVVVAACAILMYLNLAAFEMVPHPHEQLREELGQKDAHDQLVGPAMNGAVDPLQTEATYGNVQSAKLRVTFGFTASPFAAVNTSRQKEVIAALRTWEQSNDFSSLQIECLDIPPAYRSDPSTANMPLGIAINGVPVQGCTGDVLTSPDFSMFNMLSRLYRVSMPMKIKEHGGAGAGPG
jgi:hypothetical protein